MNDVPCATSTHLRFQATLSGLKLAKIPIGLMVSLSALAGSILFRPTLTPESLMACVGIFILACGAGTLNNFQDRRIDASFPRTRNRPLVIGQISESQAIFQAGILIIIGLVTLFLVQRTVQLPLLGVLTLLLYNGLYTPLKPLTMMAMIPGALCGMMPPLMGYVAAGGTGIPFRLWTFMLLIGVWQFPHSWLTLLIHRGDYTKTDIPNMLGQFSEQQVMRIVFIWAAGFSFLMLLLANPPSVFPLWIRISMLLNSVFLVSVFGIRLFCSQNASDYFWLSRCLTLSLGICMGLMMIREIRIPAF